jgi:hypothetical protein
MESKKIILSFLTLYVFSINFSIACIPGETRCTNNIFCECLPDGISWDCYNRACERTTPLGLTLTTTVRITTTTQSGSQPTTTASVTTTTRSECKQKPSQITYTLMKCTKKNDCASAQGEYDCSNGECVYKCVKSCPNEDCPTDFTACGWDCGEIPINTISFENFELKTNRNYPGKYYIKVNNIRIVQNSKPASPCDERLIRVYVNIDGTTQLENENYYGTNTINSIYDENKVHYINSYVCVWVSMAWKNTNTKNECTGLPPRQIPTSEEKCMYLLYRKSKYKDNNNQDQTCRNQDNNNDCPRITTDTNDKAFCADNKMCVYNQQCYNNGYVLEFSSAPDKKIKCADGYWIDADYGYGTCTAFGYTYPVARDDGVGEYDDQTTNECCGDDENEATITYDPNNQNTHNNLCRGSVVPTGKLQICCKNSNYKIKSINRRYVCASSCDTTTIGTTTPTTTPSVTQSTTTPSTTTATTSRTPTTTPSVTQSTTTPSTTTTTFLCTKHPFQRICYEYTSEQWKKFKNSEKHCCWLGNNLDKKYYACQPNDSDKACCEHDNMCVYNGVCYDEGTEVDVDSDGYKEKCVRGSNGKWIEIDCLSNSDCPAYAYCDITGSKTGVKYTCYDFRKDTGGCLIFDNCAGQCIFDKTATNANCYVEGDKEYQDYVKNYVCPDATKIPHMMRTCPAE